MSMSAPDSITQLIESSGNNFHVKVARWFRDRGWHIVVSPYYMDQMQSKAREIDLTAEKLWPIGTFADQRQGSIVVRLFVECKYVAADTVFWFARKNRNAAKDLVCRSRVFHENNSYINEHHYLSTSPDVAKLFASNSTRGQENEPFYKALNQALNATVSMRNQRPFHPDLAGRNSGNPIVLDFPVIVCNSFSKFYKVDFFEETEPRLIDSNFQLEVQYAFLDRTGQSRNDYFLLDFVEFEQLDSFESAIDKDAQTGASLASHN